MLDREGKILVIGDQVLLLNSIEFGEILSIRTHSCNFHVALGFLLQPENLNYKERIDWRILTIEQSCT